MFLTILLPQITGDQRNLGQSCVITIVSSCAQIFSITLMQYEIFDMCKKSFKLLRHHSVT